MPLFLTNSAPYNLQPGIGLSTSIATDLLDDLEIVYNSINVYINDDLIFDGSAFIYPYVGTLTSIVSDGYFGYRIEINKEELYTPSTWITVRVVASDVALDSIDESYKFYTKTSVKQIDFGPYEITYDLTFTGPVYNDAELTNSANYTINNGAYAKKIDKLADDQVRIWSELLYGHTSFNVVVSSNVKDSYSIPIDENETIIGPFYSTANIGSYNGLIRTSHDSRLISSDSQRIYLAGSKGLDIFKRDLSLTNSVWAQVFDSYGIDSMFLINYPSDVIISDVLPPYISYASPGDGEAVFPDTHVLFIVTDVTSSVDISSMVVYLNGQIVFRGNSGGWQEGFSGNITLGYRNISVDIWPDSLFTPDSYVIVRIIAGDMSGNIMDYSYAFEVISVAKTGFGFVSWGLDSFGGV